ncbi:MAG: hypothetical protein JO001_14970 [Alphaproteobacteria bacterium]|nr:hypothetical protein [Alphaproteobacteria bacterium]
MLTRVALLGVVLVGGITFGASAQQPYAPYSYSAQAQPLPPSYSYDPYTSGLGPCPQRYRGDPQCRYTISPTYGQPDFWPNH